MVCPFVAVPGPPGLAVHALDQSKNALPNPHSVVEALGFDPGIDACVVFGGVALCRVAMARDVLRGVVWCCGMCCSVV